MLRRQTDNDKVALTPAHYSGAQTVANLPAREAPRESPFLRLYPRKPREPPFKFAFFIKPSY
jgi:hypothetical protein